MMAPVVFYLFLNSFGTLVIGDHHLSTLIFEEPVVRPHHGMSKNDLYLERSPDGKMLFIKALGKEIDTNLSVPTASGKLYSFRVKTGKIAHSIVRVKDGKKDGLWTWWYENGQKNKEGTYKDGKMDGLWTRWHENGQNKTETTFKDGKGNGLATSWHENGQKDSEGTFKNGKPNGLVTSWHENGQKRNEATFKDGELISAECWDEDGNEKECD